MAYNRQPQTVLAGLALRQNPPPTAIQPAGIIPVTLDAEIATTTSVGVVQIGSGLSVNANGIINVTNSGNETCNTILITNDYTATLNDCYIGVQLSKNRSATLTLPLNPPDGTKYIVKLQYGAPVSNRKLTVESISPNTIDGYDAVELTTPYQSASFISQANNWYLI